MEHKGLPSVTPRRRVTRPALVAFLFCLLSGLTALAQTVTGTVTSADDNQPLPSTLR